MKSLRLFFVSFIFLFVVSCNSQPAKKEIKTTDDSSDKIEAYYFHFTARCTTCKTIEAEAKANLEALYPSQMKAGLITFQSLNLDDKSNGPLAEKLGISGQTLLLVKGGQMVNLTNEGFMYAVVKPEKFREIIDEKIAGLLIK
jgi:hypothetical protein